MDSELDDILHPIAPLALEPAAQRKHHPRGGSRSSRPPCQHLRDQDSPELRGVSRVGWMQCWAAALFAQARHSTPDSRDP